VDQAAWALRQLQGLDEDAHFKVESALNLRLELEPLRRLWVFMGALQTRAGPASFGQVSKWVAAGLLSGMGSEARPPRLEGLTAQTLAHIGNERSLEVLAQLGALTNRESEAAWRIAEAMTVQPDTSFFASVTTLAAHDDAFARAAGARALGKYDRTESVDVLLRLLSDGDWKVRATALRSLGELEEDRAHSFCAAMTADTHPLVREAALTALERLHSTEDLHLVEDSLRDPVPAVRLAAARVLASSGGEVARRAFERARRDSVDFVRSEVLDTAGDALGAEAATELFLQALRDPQVRERAQAAQALGGLGKALPAARQVEVQAALEEALLDADFVVAALAAEALGALELDGSLPDLVQAYETWQGGHPKEDVRLAIVPALGGLAADAAPAFRELAMETLERAVHDGDVRVGHAAQVALATLRAEPEPPPILPVARSDFDSTRVFPIDLGHPRVRLVTRHGEVILELEGDDYPRTVGNFLQLIDAGFYARGVFHRVVPAFVVQGGCPRGDGWGDAGKTIPCEYGPLRYDREGIVGMAHAGKDTGGSQFFITHVPVPRLDGRYTAFGRVVDGMNVLEKIVRGDSFHLERVENP
jgi:cyclophilin family peptidyl-prolyl cis-trans isomerase/HEAT repeat protein